MNYITKINVELIFPQGAHFYQNINLYTYKTLMRFIHKMNCYMVDMKCCSCSLSKDCQYYKCTGENFKYYPSILIENNTFIKSIYNKEEVLKFNLYIVDNNSNLIEYVRLFFNSYLNQELAGHYFYLKKIEIEKEEYYQTNIKSFYISSLVESTDFMHLYNTMINYYNEKYGTKFICLDIEDLTISKIKKNKNSDVLFKTKTIKRNGYIYYVFFKSDIWISSIFRLIGIGKFNFIGGGKIED